MPSRLRAPSNNSRIDSQMESQAVASTPVKSRFFDWRRSSVLRKITQLRLEEFIAYFFFIPCLAITMRANFFFWLEGYGLGRRVTAAPWRIAVAGLLLPLIPYLSRKSQNSRLFAVLRNALPFAIAIAIYTNLHDTIHFVNPHDVQDLFLKADIWLFGIEPTLWAQKFYHPMLTEILSLCYASYLPLTILLPVTLYWKHRDQEARITLITIVLCFYVGYVFYIIFPTVPPRLWIADQFTHRLEGGVLMSTQRAMVSISESSSRAAFPSLHAAITLLTFIFSWRFERKLFFVLFPLGIGLLIATIYLRHHYAVDLIAGFILAIVIYKVAADWDRRWEAFRVKLAERLQR